MPTDLETQALIERDMLDLLRDEFIGLPRSLRRRISRDTARHYARPGDRNGKTADRVHGTLARRRSPRPCSMWEFYRDRAKRAGFVERPIYEHRF